jgi:hypothetical protein
MIRILAQNNSKSHHEPSVPVKIPSAMITENKTSWTNPSTDIVKAQSVCQPDALMGKVEDALENRDPALHTR